MITKKLWMLIGLILMISSTVFALDINTVAVIPFDGKVISQEEATTLSNTLQNRLAQYGTYDLVSRIKINEVMKEHEFSSSDFVNQETAIRAGELLSAHWLFVGSVSKLGNAYLVYVELVNTETGRIVTGADGEAKTIEGLKTEVENLAKKLSTFVLSSFNYSFDVSGTVMLHNLDIHSLGVNLGFTYNLIRGISAGAWIGMHVRSEDSEMDLMYGGTLMLGDPRKQALTVKVGHIPAIGIVFHQAFIEVSPLMLLGYEDAMGISMGYSVCF